MKWYEVSFPPVTPIAAALSHQRELFSVSYKTYHFLCTQTYIYEKEMATHSRIFAWRVPLTESLAGYSPWVAESQTRLNN